MKKLASSSELSPEQTDFLAWLDEVWFDAAVRAQAHESSCAWHRRRASLLGFAATLVSAAVAVALFAIAVNDADVTTLAPAWRPLFLGIVGLAILAPVLAAVQANLRDHEHAEVHRKTSAGYFRLQQKLDLWRIDGQLGELPSRDQRAYVSQEREELFKGSSLPLRRALWGAERRVRAELRGRASLGDLRSAIASEVQSAEGAEWSLGRLAGPASWLWLPASYVAAALYLGRSPQPLADRIGTLLIVAGIVVLAGVIWKRPAIEAERLRWLYRCLPSPIGLGVLLVLLRNLLLFPSVELQASIVLWVVFDLGWRKQSSPPARSSVPKRSSMPAVPRAALFGASAASRTRSADS